MAITIRVGESRCLEARSTVGTERVGDTRYSWSSNNTAVATAALADPRDSLGSRFAVVTGVGVGTCVVTATGGGTAGTIDVTVIAAATVTVVTVAPV